MTAPHAPRRSEGRAPIAGPLALLAFVVPMLALRSIALGQPAAPALPDAPPADTATLPPPPAGTWIESPDLTNLALPEGYESSGRRIAAGERALVVRVTQPSDVALRLHIRNVHDERYAGSRRRRAPVMAGVYVNLCAASCDLRLVPGMTYRVEAFPVAPMRDSHRVLSESVFTLPEDAVELQVSYEDRTKQRRRRWIAVAVAPIVGVFLVALSYVYRGSDDLDRRNRPLFATGAFLATSPLYTFAIPMLTGNRMHVRVRRANGAFVESVERRR